jgi:hypothetical protein
MTSVTILESFCILVAKLLYEAIVYDYMLLVLGYFFFFVSFSETACVNVSRNYKFIFV